MIRLVLLLVLTFMKLDSECMDFETESIVFKKNEVVLAKEKFFNQCIEWLEEKELEQDNKIEKYYFGRIASKPSKINGLKMHFEENLVRVPIEKIESFKAKRKNSILEIEGIGKLKVNSNVFFSPTFSEPLKYLIIEQENNRFYIQAYLDENFVDVEVDENYLIFKSK